MILIAFLFAGHCYLAALILREELRREKNGFAFNRSADVYPNPPCHYQPHPKYRVVHPD